MIKHVVSVSGGKDSTATMLLALENCDRGSIVPIFCDTGNEHEAVYEYLEYLEQALDISIIRLKADFSEWTALDVFDYCGKRGIHPNPLYLQGSNRVGCMPCVNCSKDELRQISKRHPQHIERIAEWEPLVAAASKRGLATFFPAPGMSNYEASKQTIYKVVEWSKTTRGGRQFDLLGDLHDSTVCASSYGLCS